MEEIGLIKDRTSEMQIKNTATNCRFLKSAYSDFNSFKNNVYEKIQSIQRILINEIFDYAIAVFLSYFA